MESNNTTGLGACLGKNLKIFPEKTINVLFPTGAFYEDIKGTPIALTVAEPALTANYSYTVQDSDFPTFTPAIRSFVMGMILQFGVTNNTGSSCTVTARIYKNGTLVDTQISATVTNTQYCVFLYYKQTLMGLVTGDLIQVTLTSTVAGVNLNYINRVMLPLKWSLERDNSLLFNVVMAGFNNFFTSSLTPKTLPYNSYYLPRTDVHPSAAVAYQGTSNANMYFYPIASAFNHPIMGAINNYYMDSSSVYAWSYSTTGYSLARFQNPTYIKYQPSNITLPTRSV